MSWALDELTPTTFVIQDSEIIVGSIAEIDNKWMVEIMWGGPTGDIQGVFGSMELARAFIEGVEKTVTAFVAAHR